MPYEWITPDAKAPEISGAFSRSGARLHLWPYRSLPRRGFVAFMGGTVALVSLPLLVVLGSPVLWGLLPFLCLAVAGLWIALQRSYRDAEIVEDLTIAPGRMTLTRHGPRGRRQDWEGDPHRVRLHLHVRGGPVPNYLTLHGGAREVELGAFLSAQERLHLEREVRAALAAAR